MNSLFTLTAAVKRDWSIRSSSLVSAIMAAAVVSGGSGSGEKVF